MTPEQAEHLQALRDEFYADETEHDRRVAILLEVRPMAAEMMPESHCRFCKQPGLDVPWDEALVEGHCYSPEGVRDYTTITQVCEFCFDKMAKEEEEREAAMEVAREEVMEQRDREYWE